jgi:hypothetical protein
MMKTVMMILCVVGLLISIGTVDAVTTPPTEHTTLLPSAFSWQNINGTDYTTSIKDQSPAPTCEAFALVAALETKMQYQLNELYNPDLSENHLYFNAGGTIEEGGVNLNDAAKYLVQHGVPDEGCFPDPHRPADYPYYSLLGWENRTVKITEWGWIEKDITTMKQALIDHGPLIICIHFSKDFFYYFGGVYTPRFGGHGGGHVVAIVGYDDSKSCWIVKNSWGTKWGEKGWFRMAYDADMISEWYGNGTGVMYIDGIYGNLKPDVPTVHIETPRYYHTYIFGFGIPTVVKRLPIQAAAARILGPLTVEVNAENAQSVEFILDDVSQSIDTEAPFSWDLQASRGLHTLTVRATNEQDAISLDIEDIYVVF